VQTLTVHAAHGYSHAPLRHLLAIAHDANALCMQDTETPTTKPQGRGKSSNSILSADICLLYVVLRMQTCCSGVCRTYTLTHDRYQWNTTMAATRRGAGEDMVDCILPSSNPSPHSSTISQPPRTNKYLLYPNHYCTALSAQSFVFL